MLRWGDDANHSYVTGVFSKLRNACQNGIDHSDHRAGKYEPKITAHELDGNELRILVKNKAQAIEMLEEIGSLVKEEDAEQDTSPR